MKLHGFERQVLNAWSETSEDYDVLCFKSISEKSSVETSKVRRAVRGLARKGITLFHRVSWTDDGEVRGAGYGLTKLGREIMEGQQK